MSSLLSRTTRGLFFLTIEIILVEPQAKLLPLPNVLSKELYLTCSSIFWSCPHIEEVLYIHNISHSPFPCCVMWASVTNNAFCHFSSLASCMAFTIALASISLTILLRIAHATRPSLKVQTQCFFTLHTEGLCENVHSLVGINPLAVATLERSTLIESVVHLLALGSYSAIHQHYPSCHYLLIRQPPWTQPWRWMLPSDSLA